MKALLMAVILLGLVASVSLADQPPEPQNLTADFTGSPVAASATFKASVLTYARVTIQPPKALEIQGTAGTEVKQEPAAANDDPSIANAAGDGGLIEWEFNDSILTEIEVTQFNNNQSATYAPTLPPPGGDKLYTEYKLGDWYEAYTKTVGGAEAWVPVVTGPLMDWAQIEDGTTGNYGGKVIATLPGSYPGFNSADARYGRIWWGVGAKNLVKDLNGQYTQPAEKGDYYAVMIVTVHQ